MKDRAYRIAQKERVIKKRLKLVRRLDTGHVFEDGKTDYEHQLEKANKFGKKHPMDCGNPKCGLCHREKLSGDKKISEKKKLISAEQQLEDIS